MEVLYHPDAEGELSRLPSGEKVAIDHAVEKLKVLGDQLPFPHSSMVEGADKLRELRPRAGRSAWRAFYRRIGQAMVIGAIGPEAESDPKGFRRAVNKAGKRLAEVEE